MQIVHGAAYKLESDNNRIAVEPIIAPRGIIYDRNGVTLAYNEDTFNVVIDPYIFDTKNETAVFNGLAGILGISASSITQMYENGIKSGSSLIDIADNITKDQMIAITSNPLYAEVQVQTGTVRVYPYKEAIASVLGYAGLVSSQDLANNSQLTNQDTIGKDGIEEEYDSELRGVDGETILEKNTDGDTVSVLKTIPPIPGDNITLSIDINAQQKLYNDVAQGVVNNNATGGAAIIEDIHTGSILAMVTNPTYDNNLFAQGISEDAYHQLISDPHFPLLDRAISEAQPPGSVMKTITASAALQTGAINLGSIFDSEGVFEYGGHQFQDYDKIVRGRLNVIGGLQWSSNIFFYNTIISMMNNADPTGINTLIKFQKEYGLGQPTGIDLPDESSGIIASPQEMQASTGQIWYGGDSLNAAIGQGDTEVTPIQVVNWITSIANGGTLFKPSIVEKIQSYANQTVDAFSPQVVRKDFVSEANLNIIKQGMLEAVDKGIDNTVFTPVVSIAGKTGTAEFGPLDAQGNYTEEHAWATGFAPYSTNGNPPYSPTKQPQVAFVVFLEAGGLSTSSERVEKNFMNWYYGTYLKANPGML